MGLIDLYLFAMVGAIYVSPFQSNSSKFAHELENIARENVHIQKFYNFFDKDLNSYCKTCISTKPGILFLK
jgi:hypothetical protein